MDVWGYLVESRVIALGKFCSPEKGLKTFSKVECGWLVANATSGLSGLHWWGSVLWSWSLENRLWGVEVSEAVILGCVGQMPHECGEAFEGGYCGWTHYRRMHDIGGGPMLL